MRTIYLAHQRGYRQPSPPASDVVIAAIDTERSRIGLYMLIAIAKRSRAQR